MRPDHTTFERLFREHPDPMWVSDRETGRVLEVNTAATRSYGYPRDAFLALSAADLVAAGAAGARDAAGPPATAFIGGPSRHRLASGAVIEVELRVQDIEFAGRLAVLVVAGDVTDRKRAEEKLRESEERYRTVVDSIRPVIFQMDARGVWTFLSAAWAEITGFTVDESLGTHFLRYVHPDDRQRHAEAFQPLLDNRGEDLGLEARYLTRTGGSRWVEVLGQVMFGADGCVLGVRGTLTDITERKRAEEELSATRARLEHLLLSSAVVVYSSATSTPFPITFISENVAREFGYRVDDVLDDPQFWRSCVHPDDLARVLDAVGGLTRAPSETSYQSLEYRVRDAHGECRWIQDARRLIRDAAGRPIEIIGTWVDLTARRLAEEERTRLSSAVEQSAEAILITSPDGTIQYVNPACERLTGYAAAELLGQRSRMLKPERQDAAPYGGKRTALLDGQAWSGRLVAQRKDGSHFDAEVVISPVRDAEGRLAHYVGSMHDVTPQREMEEQLRQSQKMEIAGRLAGGIAHDFNNHLTVIIGRSQLLLHRLRGDETVERDVNLIQETARRAADLTRQLLLFSRKKALARRPLDLGGVVAGMEMMLRRLIGEDVDLQIVRDADLGRTMADPGQIEQVLMNLVVNARDAMPHGGRLTLETRNVMLGEGQRRRVLGADPGAYVMVAVVDTGLGMDAEVKAHLFEPFFTTKGPDRGTGLGLSIVYGIVKQNDGHIAVESEPGKGTAFRIYLPQMTEPAAPEQPQAAARRSVRGSETVLLVEDETQVRELAREILAAHGYQVLVARHGFEALDIARKHAGPIRVVLTDVVMPHMNGPQLVDRLTVLRPEARVVFMSGYTDDSLVDRESLLSRAPMIDKPFTPERLARTVREVLDAPADTHLA